MLPPMRLGSLRQGIPVPLIAYHAKVYRHYLESACTFATDPRFQRTADVYCLRLVLSLSSINTDRQRAVFPGQSNARVYRLDNILFFLFVFFFHFFFLYNSTSTFSVVGALICPAQRRLPFDIDFESLAPCVSHTDYSLALVRSFFVPTGSPTVQEQRRNCNAARARLRTTVHGSANC